METTKLKVESFSIQFSNSDDDNRVYNIDARFEKQTSGNENIEAGSIHRNGNILANFNKNSEGNSYTITFYGSAPIAEQSKIMEIVDEFVAAGKDRLAELIPVTE